MKVDKIPPCICVLDHDNAKSTYNGMPQYEAKGVDKKKITCYNIGVENICSYFFVLTYKVEKFN